MENSQFMHGNMHFIILSYTSLSEELKRRDLRAFTSTQMNTETQDFKSRQTFWSILQQSSQAIHQKVRGSTCLQKNCHFDNVVWPCLAYFEGTL